MFFSTLAGTLLSCMSVVCPYTMLGRIMARFRSFQKPFGVYGFSQAVLPLCLKSLPPSPSAFLVCLDYVLMFLL